MNDIVLDSDPILRKESGKVEFPLDFETKQTARDMMDFLIRSQNEELAEKDGLRPGVGIAAPQLGILKQFICVYVGANPDDEDQSPLLEMTLFNPRIIAHSVQEIGLKAGEGCLSVDYDVQGFVSRHNRITVEYQDETGEVLTAKFKGFFAIILQHEIDHLNGVLFYDHINKQNPLEIPADALVLE
jgi:peptide deformylase